MNYTINGYEIALSLQKVQGKTEYHSKITKNGKTQAVIMDMRSTGHGFVPLTNPDHFASDLSELKAVSLHIEAVKLFKASGKVSHVEIHNMRTARIKILNSGDRYAWSQLDDADKSGIKSATSMMQSITMGSMTYVPVF
tara:strand:- start:113 stop:529 length:417 start_codon:yes stop_codon:yes gene_type:complete